MKKNNAQNVFEWLQNLRLKRIPILPHEGALWCGHRSHRDYSDRFPWIVKKLSQRFQFKTYVEIGIAEAGGLRLIYKNWENPLIIGIDPLPEPKRSLTLTNPKFNWIFNEKKVHLIRKKSQDAVTQLSTILNGTKIDFLNIDGDHTEIASTFDFVNYYPFVKKGGLIWLDDIKYKKSEVGKTWEKIKNKTIISDAEYDYWHWGIGEKMGQKKRFTEAIDGVWIYKKS